MSYIVCFFVASIKIRRIKPLYEVVVCLSSTSAKQTTCLTAKEFTFAPMHTSTANCFPQSMYGRLVLYLLKSRDNIAVLLLTHFLSSLHEYF